MPAALSSCRRAPSRRFAGSASSATRYSRQVPWRWRSSLLVYAPADRRGGNHSTVANRHRWEVGRSHEGPAMSQMIAPGEALPLNSLVTPTADGIASRILAKTSGGDLTLFAFAAGQGLTEHTSPFEAIVMVLEGACTLTIG